MMRCRTLNFMIVVAEKSFFLRVFSTQNRGRVTHLHKVLYKTKESLYETIYY